MTESVILLHGLWMRAVALRLLARRLRAQGFVVERFDYASLMQSPAANIARLQQRMRRLGPGPVHLVGHSLGGLLALQALNAAVDLPPGRVVCLGSPLAGSRAAAGLGRRRSGALLMGRSGALVREGIGTVPPQREVGVVAGRNPVGLGQVFGRFREPHDGTVAVAETRIPGLADHVVIGCTHTGLIFSQDATRLTVAFLRNGRFDAATTPEAITPAG